MLRRGFVAGCLLVVALFLSVTPTFAQITGTVFEDTTYNGGAGRSLASSGGTGIQTVRVELYNGTTGAYIRTANTNAAGVYSLAASASTSYIVRVVAPIAYRGGQVAGTRGVQTFRTNYAGGVATGDTNRVGGQDPSVVEAGNGAAGTTMNTSTYAFTAGIAGQAQSIGVVTTTAGGTAAGVDFGFSFNLVTNILDTGQGSLRQWITNINALGAYSSGTEFFISDGNSHSGQVSGLVNQLTSGVAIIKLASVLPTIAAANAILDGSSQGSNVGNTNAISLGTGGTVGTGGFAFSTFPGNEIEVQSNTGADLMLTASGTGVTIQYLACHQVPISLQGANDVAQWNVVGMHANGSITTALQSQGVTIGASSGIKVLHNYVKTNNSAIRRDGNGSTATIQYNEVDNPGAQTNTFDGILLIGSGSSSGDVIQYNLVKNLNGGGIELGFAGTLTLTNVLIDNNTVSYNGYTSPAHSAASTEPLNIATYLIGSGSSVTISHNVVVNSGGPGVMIMSATGIKISQNSIHTNGLGAGTLAPGIQLDPTARDPNTYGTAPGPTPNTGTKNCGTLPNCGMNYPVFTWAALNSTTNNLHVKGYVGSAAGQATFAAATIEFFTVDNVPANQNGAIISGDGKNVPHGEGTRYIGSTVADANGNFDVTLAGTGVLSTDAITATATDASGNTSEFSANINVVLVNTIAGSIFVDPNHNGVKDAGEGWTSTSAPVTNTFVNLVSGGALAPILVPSITIPVSAAGTYTFIDVPAGNYTIIVGNSAIATTATFPPGYVPTAVGTAAATATLAVTMPSTPAPVTGQDLGFFKGSSVYLGTVFQDTGTGGGTANNGAKDGSEAGLNGVVVTATSGALVFDSMTTSATGLFTVYIPSTATTVTLTRGATAGYLATGGNAGTTAGTYTRASETIVFTAVAGTQYTGVLFGDVPVNTLSMDNASFVPSGASTYYPHTFVAGSSGTVTFTTSAVATPPLAGWAEAIYYDTTNPGSCTTTFSANYALVTANMVMTPGQQLCLLLKETAPVTGTGQNAVTLMATFAYTNASPALNAVVKRLDTSTSGNGPIIRVTKVVDKAQAYPNDTLTYTITYTNIGGFTARNFTVNDSVPNSTTFLAAACGSPLPANFTACAVTTAPAVGGTGTVTWSFTGILSVGTTGTVTLQVKVR